MSCGLLKLVLTNQLLLIRSSKSCVAYASSHCLNYPKIFPSNKSVNSYNPQNLLLLHKHPTYLSTSSLFAVSKDSVRYNSTEETDNGKKQSKMEVLKKVLSQYGAFGLTVHIILSLMSLGVTYLLILWGLDAEKLLKSLGVDTSNGNAPQLAGYSVTFVAAYTVHKVIVPLRATVSIIVIRYLVRYLRKMGYFKK